MKTITNTLVKVLKDEQGGEVLEYALIAGLIVVGRHCGHRLGRHQGAGSLGFAE